MRCNEETVLLGNAVVLVPYRAQHVPKYHEWMEDEELREQTASERLSLADERRMQRAWRLDEDKLTFIVLVRPAASRGRRAEGVEDALRGTAMVGDVNVFLHPDDEDEEGEGEGEEQQADGTARDGADANARICATVNSTVAELEVMIAERSYRRQGLAYEALQLLLWYLCSPLAPPGPTSPTDAPPPFEAPPSPTRLHGARADGASDVAEAPPGSRGTEADGGLDRREAPGPRAASTPSSSTTTTTTKAPAWPLRPSPPFPVARSRVLAKVSLRNPASSALFARLGMRRARVSEVWGEEELRWPRGGGAAAAAGREADDVARGFGGGKSPVQVLRWPRSREDDEAEEEGVACGGT